MKIINVSYSKTGVQVETESQGLLDGSDQLELNRRLQIIGRKILPPVTRDVVLVDVRRRKITWYLIQTQFSFKWAS